MGVYSTDTTGLPPYSSFYGSTPAMREQDKRVEQVAPLAAMLKGGDNLDLNYEEIKGKTWDQLASELSTSMMGQVSSQMENDILPVVATGGMTAEEAGTTVQELGTHYLKEYAQDNPRLPENAFVDSMSPMDLSELVKEQAKADMYYRRKMGELTEGASVADWGAMFLIPKLNINLANVTGEINPVEAGKVFRDMIAGFDTMAPAEKIALQESLFNEINAATNENELQTAYLVNALLNGDDLARDRVLDGLDTGFTAGALIAPVSAVFKGLYGMKKTSSLVKNLKKVGREDLSEALNDAVLDDPSGEIGKVVGMDKTTATANKLPFNNSAIMPEYVALTDKGQENAQLIQEVSKLVQDSRMGILTQKELAEAIRTRTEEFKALPYVDNVTEVAHDKDGIVFEYTLIDDALNDDVLARVNELKAERLLYKREAKDANKEYLEFKAEGVKVGAKKREEVLATKEAADKKVEELSAKIRASQSLDTGLHRVQSRIKFTDADIGAGIRPSVGPVEATLASANQKFWKGAEELAESGVQLLLKEDKNRHLLNETLSQILKPLGVKASPKARRMHKELNELLLQGDALDKRYSLAELLKPIDLPSGTVTLTKEQRTAYLNTRHLMDEMYNLEEQAVRRSATVQGYKGITFEGEKQVGKVYDNVLSAQAAGAKKPYIFVENPHTGAPRFLNDVDDLKDWYEQGYKLVRMTRPVTGSTTKTNKKVSFILAKEDDIGSLPKMINYSPGYIPKFNKDGFYFTKVTRKDTVDGTADTVTDVITDRGFSSKREADERLAMLQSEEGMLALKEKYGDNIEVNVFHDRELPFFGQGSHGVVNGNKEFTGARKQEGLKFGNGEGYLPERLSAFESIRRNINDVSKRVPLTEWRLGMQQRWLNSAKAAGAVPKYENDFFAAKRLVEDATLDADGKRGLLEAHKYIETQIRVPSDGERNTMLFIRGIAEKVEHISPKFAKVIHRLDNSDPVAAYKAAAFHSMLGMFNPAQWWVQAQGASIAMSINPIHGAKALPYWQALMGADNIKDPVAKKKFLKEVGSKLGVKDVEELHSVWEKSGFPESIKSIGDLDSIAHGLPMDKVFTGAVGRVADWGLIPYKMGEITNRRISFATAYNWWKAEHKGKKLDDVATKAIIDRADMYMLNMTRASKANWQLGWSSIPTQFFQVNTRFMELLAGGRLSPAEKTRLLLMQGALYGSAGVPLGTQLARYLGSDEEGALQEDYDPRTAEARAIYVRGGVPDLMAKYIFGADVSLGTRSGIAGGIVDSVLDMFAGDRNLLEVLSGPGANVGDRVVDFARTFATFGVAPIFDENAEVQWSPVLDALVDITSSGNNATKAYLLNNLNTMATDHNIVYNDKDPELNFATVLARGLGFTTNQELDAYAMHLNIRERDQALEDVTDMAVKAMYRGYREGENSLALYNNVVYLYSQMLPEFQQEDFRERIARKIQGDSTYARALKRQLQDVIEGKVDNQLNIPSLHRELGQERAQ